MKRLLLLSVFLLGLFAASQAQFRMSWFRVPDKNTAFGVALNANSIVFEVDSAKAYLLTSAVLSTNDMHDVFASGNYAELIGDCSFTEATLKDTTESIYAEFSFYDETGISLDLSAATWKMLTGSDRHIWDVSDTSGIDINEDIIRPSEGGKYLAVFNLSVKSTGNDIFGIRLKSDNDSTPAMLWQNTDTVNRMSITSSGILNLAEEESIIPEIINNSSNEDCDIYSGSIVLYKAESIISSTSQTISYTTNSYTNDIYNVYDYLYYYGVKYQPGEASTLLTKEGGVTHHETLPVHADIKAGIVNNDGSINYYLSDTNFYFKQNGDSSILNGTDGQVMIIIPEHYRRVYRDSGYEHILLSQYPLENFVRVDSFAIGAYNASISTGDTLCSISGDTATTSITRTNARAYAAKRGEGWSVLPYEQYKSLIYLYLIEFACFNSQDSISLGATNASSSDWNNYNGYNPVFQTGKINQYGLITGGFTDSVPSFIAGSTTLTVERSCFYGIEDIFGHIWQWLDGVNIYNASGGGSRFFTCSDPVYFSDSDTATNYTYIGKGASEDGYITEILTGEIIPADVGGSSSTYLSDYYYTQYDNDPAGGFRALCVGGRLSTGSLAGLLCSNSNYSAGSSHAIVSARLCLVW